MLCLTENLYIYSIDYKNTTGMPHLKKKLTYIYVCTQGSPAENQSPAHWNLTGRRMIAPSPLLSPSSTLPPPSSHFNFIPARKNSGCAKKSYVFSPFWARSHKCEKRLLVPPCLSVHSSFRPSAWKTRLPLEEFS